MNKSLWRPTLLAGLLISGLLACAAPAADQERVSLEAAIHRLVWAANVQNVSALNKTLTEDVELLDETSTVTGRDAASQALRELAKHGQLVATTREITIAHDVAWHVVGLAQTLKNGDVQALGQALEIWKRNKGEWRLHRRMVTGTGTPKVSLTRPSTKEPVLDRPGN